jgi:ABC-type Fe3+ transport system permease subunit
MGGKGQRKNSIRVAGTKSIIFLLILLLISVFLPVIMLVLQAFANGTDAFVQAFELLYSAIWNSLLLALLSAFVILLTGFFAALKSFGNSGKNSRNIFDRLLLIAFATPSVIFGISLIKFYNHPELNIIYSSVIIMILAYVGKYSFISAKLMGNAIKQIPVSLYEAASVAGVSLFKQITGILLPLIMPSVIASFIMAFVLSFGELGMTVMLYPPGTEILLVKVFTLSANATQSLTSSMSLIVLMLMLLLVVGFYAIANPFVKKNMILYAGIKKYNI